MATLLEGFYAGCEKVRLVLDTSKPARQGAFIVAFEPAWTGELARRIEFSYTPKHGCWLNIAENEAR